MKKLSFFLMAILMSVMSFAETESITLSSGTHDGSKITWTAANGNITISQLKAASSTAVNASYIAAPRIYKGHILKFECAEGYGITNIDITYSSSYYGTSLFAGTTMTSTAVTANTTDLTSTFATSTSGGTHKIVATKAEGEKLIALQIPNNAASGYKQLRPTAIKVTYAKAASSTPAIACGDVNFGTVNGANTNTKELEVVGENLTEVITATLEEGAAFSVSGSLDETGGTLTVTVTATEEGQYTDQLTLTSGTTTKTVAISAKVVACQGKGTKEEPYTIGDLTKLANPGTKAWVAGYIIGEITNNELSTSGFTTNSNIALAEIVGKTKKYAPIQLPTGDVRNKLNLVDNPTNLNKQVVLYGTLEAYYSLPGVKNVSAYEFLPEPVVNHTITVSANPVEGGIVTGGGEFEETDEITVKAVANEDYEFTCWTEGTDTVATTAEYTFEVLANRNLVANFVAIPAPEVKSGKFSVGENKLATFAPGNLQFNTGDSTWRFAREQYNVVGAENINLGDPAFKGWIDMFGWSTAETYFGVNPSNSNELYDGEFVDWGKVFEGENWSTLSADEWKYLLNTRANATQLKQIATIDTVLGIMLFPDAWVMPEGIEVAAKLDTNYNVNVYNYTVAQWDALEDAGAIFLPAAGRRTGGYGNMINYDQQVETREDYLVNGGFYRWQDNTNIYCYYWTSTINENKNVSYLNNIVALGNDEYTIGTGAIWGEKGRYGQSVRLAQVETVEIVEPVKTIEWVLNGGDFPAVVVPTNAELWEAFKPYYNKYYTANGKLVKDRADQPIDKVSTFAAAYMQEIMTDEKSEYKWLGDYVLGVAAGQGVTLPTDMASANEGAWRWAVHAFFNATAGANGAAGTDFTEAGKPEVWGAAYQAAYGVVLPTEAVEADYTLPTPVKTGFTFVGWYDNAEGEGDAMTVLKAGWSGTIYAIWKQDATTGVDNTIVAEQVVKIVRNGQVLIMVGDKTFNMMGQEVK
jgi:uncharacterized repeat protein (TIGR02543 family)